MRICIIGAGIIGTLIARQLGKFDIEVILIEKEYDVGLGVSKANSAIIHAGYDDEPGTYRARFCSKGNMLYDELARQLDIEVVRVGSHVLAFNNEQRNVLNRLYQQGLNNNVRDLRILERDEILDMEPNINPDVVASLYAPSAGITEPWQICIAATENAAANGVEIHFNEEVIDIDAQGNKVRRVITDKHEYQVDYVINAAGLYADRIANMAKDVAIPIHPRIGEYILLNKFTSADLIHSIIFPTPSKMGKGILIIPTVDKGILLGPTSLDLNYRLKDLRATSSEGLEQIVENAKKLIPGIDIKETVKTFAGCRPETSQKDFYLGASRKVYGFFNVAGMRSPGLTAAPAIAQWTCEELQKAYNLKFNLKKDYNPYRKKIFHYYNNISLEDYDKEIQRYPEAGKFVCVCNKITEKEVIEAIKRGATTLDAIKFRTRAMFGECQGGFCTHKILQILSRELGIPLEKLVYNNAKSYVVDGKVRK
jgi:glycerol-3-phosphate dehydrogenase